MTEAAYRQTPPAPDPAGDIGGVLASIRQMIAQDDGPARVTPPERATVLRLGTAPPSRGSADAPPAMGGRDDLTSRTRGLTLREAAPAGPLRLDAATRVVPEDLGAGDECPAGAPGTPAAKGEASPGPAQSQGERTLDATASPLTADEDRRAASGHSADAEAPDLSTCGSTAAEPAAMPTGAEPMAGPEPTERAAPPTCDEPALVQEPAMTAHDATLIAAAPTGPAAAADDESSTIFSTMIREVIRQELVGNGSGEMSRDLRAMILREVARAITGGDMAASGR